MTATGQESILPRDDELVVARLGEARYPSPLRGTDTFIGDSPRIFVASATDEVDDRTRMPAFEAAGPRDLLYFEPDATTCGIVTCGGLCPGLNDVIRSIVLTSHHRYGIGRVVGFRYGYAGLARDKLAEPIVLELDDVKNAHRHGGTMLGSSRGPQDLDEMVDTLVAWGIDILFCIGGDGTLSGANELAARIAERELTISVIGIPKTIDNDLLWSKRSFGFMTAVEAARDVIEAAHSEAEGAYNGVGLVKLMGRYSGAIAASATLANGDVNFCLVPEVPFTLDGEGGLLEVLEQRLQDRAHALIVAAEGAGQNLFDDAEDPGRDASGNRKLHDIGARLREAIKGHCGARGMPVDIKYIDPSYTIRGLAANSMDSSYCMVLGQHAVHAGMSGRTDMMVGFWNDNFTHVPLSLVTRATKHLDPLGEIWQRVLDATGQPVSMAATSGRG